jgi:hypothetical protein
MYKYDLHRFVSCEYIMISDKWHEYGTSKTLSLVTRGKNLAEPEIWVSEICEYFQKLDGYLFTKCRVS